ncbi:MAG: adenosylcobinamide-phosphate synthase CbiB [Pseudomonadota bacterium]
MLSSTLGLLVGVLLDRWWGEPQRFHPLVLFGVAASALEKIVYPTEGALPERAPQRGESGIPLAGVGLSCCLLLVGLPVVILLALLTLLPSLFSAVLSVVVLYICLGGKSLEQHAQAIAAPLEEGDLGGAQTALSAIVSRDTRTMDDTEVVRATVESVLENGNDAVFASLFWFAVAGPAGALAHRLVNTLDAMWGYRTERYQAFGWAAARLDDVLGWLPARGCALCYALAARQWSALSTGFRQAASWDSPNAGPVMAVGAASLDVVVGGPARYGGEDRARPWLGSGAAVVVSDIGRACQLVLRASLLFIVAVALGEWLI